MYDCDRVLNCVSLLSIVQSQTVTSSCLFVGLLVCLAMFPEVKIKKQWGDHTYVFEFLPVSTQSIDYESVSEPS
jgi:hypothetical protein